MATTRCDVPEDQREEAVRLFRDAFGAAGMTDAEILREISEGDLRCPHCDRWDCGVRCPAAMGEDPE